jgi:hypothetical protein
MNQAFSLAWNVSNPDLTFNNVHQAVSLGLDLRI